MKPSAGTIGPNLGKSRDPRIKNESWGTSGHVYWIELVPGYAFKGSALHNIAAFSKAQAHAKMHKVVPCSCATCKILSQPAAFR